MSKLQTAQELVDAIVEVSNTHGVALCNMHINLTLPDAPIYSIKGALVEVLHDPEILSDRSVASNIELKFSEE